MPILRKCSSRIAWVCQKL